MHIRLADLNSVNDRQREVVATDLLAFGGAQLAVGVTLVSPLATSRSPSWALLPALPQRRNLC